MKLTSTQQQAIDRMRSTGESLERRPGGFWTTPSTPRGPLEGPEWYVGTPTVRALLRVGAVVEDGVWYRVKIVA